MHSTRPMVSEMTEINGNVREAESVPYLINEHEYRDFVMLNVDIPIYSHLKNDMKSLFDVAKTACIRAEEASLQIEETAVQDQDSPEKTNAVTIDEDLVKRCDKAMKQLQNSLNELEVVYKTFTEVKQKTKADSEMVRMKLTNDRDDEGPHHNEIFSDLNQVSIDNPVKSFTDSVEDRLNEWRRKRALERYSDTNAEDYKRFKQAIWLIRRPEEDLPTKWWYKESDYQNPNTTMEDGRLEANGGMSKVKREARKQGTRALAKGENGVLSDEDVDEDEDIETAAAKISLICPVSRQLFVNPVTSRVCGHSFSKGIIDELCQQDQSRGSFKCPVCQCDLNKRQLQPNETLAARVKYMELNSRKNSQREKRTMSSLDTI